MFDWWVLHLALCIEMTGTLMVAGGCVRGVVRLFWYAGREPGLRECRLAVADAVVAGLGFKIAATLLKTIELRSWEQIAMFAAILALRTLIKFALGREREQLAPA